MKQSNLKTPTGMYALISFFYLVAFVTMNAQLSKIETIENATISNDVFWWGCNIALLVSTIGVLTYAYVLSKRGGDD